MSEIKRRGRPSIAHDNRRVCVFLRHVTSAFELTEEWPCLDDVLTGVTLLQSEGQGSTRPMSKRLLFLVLKQCETISTQEVLGSLGRDYSQTTAKRYAALARVASKAIARVLEQHPAWEAAAALLNASREEIDAPYLAEARALNLAL